MKTDLTYGTDYRGETAFFIDDKHFVKGGLDAETKAKVGDRLVFFRTIKKGLEQRSHGWIEGGEVIQWG